MTHAKAPAGSTRQGPRAILALAVLLSLALFAGPAFAAGPGDSQPSDADTLSVASSELQSAAGADIVFINYEGPQSRIETAAEITAIGSGLGQPLRAQPPAALVPARRGDFARYAVIRAVDPATKTGLEADILVLGADAQVDHIKNLRRIIAGYLEAAWGYSAKDAATLAVYVTVYNAVHRGDMAYFSGRYKAVAQKELTPAKAGLSLRWDEWPGKSLIVIPLARGARPGALGAIDTGAVSDKSTVDSLRGQPDAGLGDRQAMTELKDREAEERAAALAAKQAEIARDEAALAAQKAAVAEQQAKLDQAKAAEAAGGGAGTAAGTTGAAGAAGETQTASLADQEAALKAAQDKTAADEAALAGKKADAATDAAALTAKKDEVAADRTTIAADQKAAIAADVAGKTALEAAGIYLYQLIDATGPYARVVFVDATTGKLIRASVVNSIRPRAVVDSGDSFVAVAGKEGGTGAIRLVRLLKKDLVQSAEGKTDLFPDSALWKAGDAFFAVAKGAGTSWYLARFDAGLVEIARTTVAINPFTALVEGKDGLIVQTAKGGFIVLSPDKLALVRELQP